VNDKLPFFRENSTSKGGVPRVSSKTHNHGIAAAGLLAAIGLGFFANVGLAAPSITIQPVSQTIVGLGSSVTLSVAATASSGSLSYQWTFYGAPLPGATSATLTIDSGSIQEVDSGPYKVIVTDSAGSTTSAEADVYVGISIGLVGQYVNFESFPAGPGTLEPEFYGYQYGSASISGGSLDPISGVLATSTLGTGKAGYIGGAGTDSTLTTAAGDFGVEVWPGSNSGTILNMTNSGYTSVQFDIDLAVALNSGTNGQSFDFDVYDAGNSSGNAFQLHSAVIIDGNSGEITIQDNQNSSYVDTGVAIASGDKCHLTIVVNYQTATWSAKLQDLTSSHTYTLASGRPIDVSGFTLSGWTSLSQGWVDIDMYASTASSTNEGFADRIVFDNYTVTVLAPQITLQPVFETIVNVGGTANLSAAATGEGTLSYQWDFLALWRSRS
jgi:hypothetical protein